jgi:glycosyltransferase involved in cell wall biosynthesis
MLNKHNAMYNLIDQELRRRSFPEHLRNRIVKNHKQFEEMAIENSDCVVFQSSQDEEAFDIPENVSSKVIPNGTNFEEISQSEPIKKIDINSNQITLNDRVCIFVGAYDYGPNQEAAKIIDEEIAPELPNIEFLLIGRNAPVTNSPNCHPVGYVDNLPGYLNFADIALCPLLTGSGTKLKMLDYLAAGLPTVVTKTGAAGIQLKDGENAIISDIDNMAQNISLLYNSPDLMERISNNAEITAEHYSWEKLMGKYENVIRDL